MSQYIFLLFSCFSFPRWFTSGCQRGGVRDWMGDSQGFVSQSNYWAVDSTIEKTIADRLNDDGLEARLVYEYSGKFNEFFYIKDIQWNFFFKPFTNWTNNWWKIQWQKLRVIGQARLVFIYWRLKLKVKKPSFYSFPSIDRSNYWAIDQRAITDRLNDNGLEARLIYEYSGTVNHPCLSWLILTCYLFFLIL